MFLKLFKYDFKTSARFGVPILIAVAAAALIGAVNTGITVSNVGKESTFEAVTNAPFGELLIFLGMGGLMLVSVALAAAAAVMSVLLLVQYYRSTAADEAYLTFTLPLTNTEHIYVKLLGAMVCQFICLITIIVAGSIALSGQPLKDIINLFDYLIIDELFANAGVINSILIFTEVIILLIISAVSNMLLYYACITVGQTAKKNRILMAVGAYFIYYIATQIISTIFTIIIMVLAMSNAFDDIFEWFSAHSIFAIHIYLCCMIIVFAILSVVFWIVTHTIMSKKLNLE